MTVAELIEQLRKFKPTDKVFIADSGFDPNFLDTASVEYFGPESDGDVVIRPSAE